MKYFEKIIGERKGVIRDLKDSGVAENKMVHASFSIEGTNKSSVVDLKTQLEDSGFIMELEGLGAMNVFQRSWTFTARTKNFALSDTDDNDFDLFRGWLYDICNEHFCQLTSITLEV